MTMCKCVNIEMGSYDNQVSLITPEGRSVGIDNCIAVEIQELWKKGIKTIESCCGHNKVEGYIAVIDEDIIKMKKMGYKKHINKNFPAMNNFFIPKSCNN